jgi:DNA polymerase III subunit alpha
MTDFVHLHVHSEYSLLDGMSTPEEMAATASTHGQTSLAITDHGSMAGVLKFQDACSKQNVKPIFGIEAYFTPDMADDTVDAKTERFHLILLAKNNEGLSNLFRLNNEAWMNGFYYKPRMDFPMLERIVNNDIIALSGCRGSSIAKAIEAGNWSRAERLSEKFIDIFGDDFYFEIQSWNPEEINKGLIMLADSYGKKVVPTLDCHYPSHSDAGVEEVLLTVAQFPSMNAAAKRYAMEHNGCAKKTGMDITSKINTMYPDRRLRFDDIQPYIMGAAEIRDLFLDKGLGDHLENTLEVADKCNAEISKKRYLLPKYDEKFDSVWYLREIANMSMSSKGFAGESEYVDRLNEEIDTIEKTGFADYFLVIWDLVNWARNSNIGVGPGRGSVGGSLLAYLMDITIVDPIKYDLLFARFINPDRNDYPDIDLDFEDKRRGEVKEYLKNRWGADNVASISAFGVFKAKSAVKDVARVFGVEFREINGITQLFESLKDMNRSPKVREFCDKYVDVKPVAERLEGRVRTAGMHAAGVVVSSKPLWEVCPVESRKDASGDGRTVVTAFDMDDAEAVGLIKIDILGLKTVSVVKDCLSQISEHRGLDVESESLSLDDPAVFAQFDSAETTGVFQADAGAYRSLLEHMPCESFIDLVISNALVRPGALLTQGDKFVKRRSGQQRVKYPHSSLKPILEETYGTFIFQEQLMHAVVILAGFSWAEADSLRKIIGKKRDMNEFEQYRKRFVENNVMSAEASEKMWDDFEVSALYMFNKSHAVAYSMLSYQTMWLKLNYPLEFCWALLANESSREKVTAYLLEAKRLGVEVKPPDVNHSDEFFSVDYSGEGSIRFGLSNIDGVGKSAIKEIMQKRPFSSYDELTGRCAKRYLRRNVLESLDKIGSLESLGHISEYDHSKYYMPLLGFPIAQEIDDKHDDLLAPASSVHEDEMSMSFVKAVVRSIKRSPTYVRIEFEDPTGSFTVFSNLDIELKKRDYVYALIGDRSLQCYNDVEDESGAAVELMNLMRTECNHDHAWLYEHGLGSMNDSKALAYVVNVRQFKTSKGQSMATVYVWDGKQFSKIVIFPHMYGRYAQKLGRIERTWVAVKPTPISNADEGFKVDGTDDIIDIDDFCRRMKINVSS